MLRMMGGPPTADQGGEHHQHADRVEGEGDRSSRCPSNPGPVSKGSAPGTLTGTVSFTDDGAAIPGCSKLHLIVGVAACVTGFPTTGNYAITAKYSSDPPLCHLVGQLDPGHLPGTVDLEHQPHHRDNRKVL